MATRNHIRYYNQNGEFINHGEFIYESLPQIGDIINPVLEKTSAGEMRVLKLNSPENHDFYEIYIEELK